MRRNHTKNLKNDSQTPLGFIDQSIGVIKQTKRGKSSTIIEHQHADCFCVASIEVLLITVQEVRGEDWSCDEGGR